MRLDEGKGVVVMDRVINNQQIDALLATRAILELSEDCLKIQQSYAKDTYKDI